MRGIALGIDCGTSIVKFSAVEPQIGELEQHRVRACQFAPRHGCDDRYASRTWRIVSSGLNRLLYNATARADHATGVAITAIAPVLVLFDTANPDRAVSTPYWPIAELDDDARGIQRAMRRVALLRAASQRYSMRAAAISDLVGYLNFRLTGNLTLNTTSAAELGFATEADLAAIRLPDAPEPTLLAPCGTVGLLNGRLGSTIVCGGASDSFAAAMHLGPRGPRPKLVYLGTFGSVLEVQANIDEALQECQIHRVPYRWCLSVPRFGPTIEAYATQSFPAATVTASLQLFDRAALAGPPGADGVLFRLPFWDERGAERGSFGFTRAVENLRRTVAARAVLEALGHLMRARLGTFSGVRVCVCGGGSASGRWMKILADTLGASVSWISNSNGALMTAVIAAAATGVSYDEMYRLLPREEAEPNLMAYDAASQTSLAALSVYQYDASA